MRAFHGTSFEHAKAMIQSDFKSDKESCTWHCSDDRNLYVYPMNKVYAERFQRGEAEEYECIHAACLERAAESGQINAAFHNSAYGNIVVFEFNFPRDLMEDDYSCDNMSSIASCVAFEDIKPEHVKNVYLIDSYSPSLRLFVLAGLSQNKELAYINLIPAEQTMLERVVNSDCYLDPEDLYYAVSEAVMLTPEQFKDY